MWETRSREMNLQTLNCIIGWSVPRALLGGMSKSALVREGFNGSISFGFGKENKKKKKYFSRNRTGKVIKG